MIRCIVVDDEPHAVKLITGHVEKTPGLELALATTQPQEAVALANTGDVDLIFSDVEMPEMSGFDIIKAIPRRVKMIFCTGYKKYALDGYDFNVLDYLLKPVTYARFIQSAQRAINLIETEKKAAWAIPQGHIFIQAESRSGRVKINLEDITLVESANHYTNITCLTEKLLASVSMKELQEMLPQDQFIRVHNSFIIPLRNVKFIDASNIRLLNVEEPVPIGPTYKEAVFKALNIQMGGN